MRRSALRMWAMTLAVPCVLGLAAQSAHAGAIGGAWSTIYDGTNSETYTIQSSLSDFNYIAPGDTSGNGVLGGVFATQVGAAAFDVQEGPGTLGQVSLDFEYFDATPIAVGTAQIVNFNISGPDDPGGLSDTLSISFTGHLDGNNNMSIDLHYLSDNDLGMYPATLPNATAITETGQYQDLSAAIQSATGLSNFNLQFTSAVVTPEPASLILLGIGLAGFAGFRRRQLRAARAASDSSIG